MKASFVAPRKEHFVYFKLNVLFEELIRHGVFMSFSTLFQLYYGAPICALLEFLLPVPLTIFLPSH